MPIGPSQTPSGQPFVHSGTQLRQPYYVLPGTVYDAALKRIRWLFDEFDNRVSASCSGGKDSTIIVELAALVARERGVKLKVHFLDQEAEYAATIDYLRYLATRPDIDLDWYQIPFRLFNATSHTEQWSHVWDPTLPDNEDGSKWIRPKEPGSIHTSPFPASVDRFKPLLSAMNVHDGGAILTGMRCEESPTRRTFMTTRPSYKWATWSSSAKTSVKHGFSCLFHPIYDWSYRDVWKAIHANDWRYNTFYDVMFRYGVSLKNMRVSSFHHEQSNRVLDYLQEIEPATWEAATRRLPGINTYGHVGIELNEYFLTHLPHMFSSWEEYLNYQIEHLVEHPEDRVRFRKMWAAAHRQCPWIPREDVVRRMLDYVFINDVYGSNMAIWLKSMSHPSVRAQLAEEHPELAAATA